MMLGKNILELRRQNNITQEELAAELGVTAAAVSKWENGYTLPDVLMLCALADYFHVTTDALLGLHKTGKFAVVAAETDAIQHKIADLLARYRIDAKHFVTDYPSAIAATREDKTITHLMICCSGDFNGTQIDLSCIERPIYAYISLENSEADMLHGIEEYLKE